MNKKDDLNVNFQDISPYCDDEIPKMMKRLAGNDLLISMIRGIKWPSCPVKLFKPANFIIKKLLARKFKNIKTINDFQVNVVANMLLKWVLTNSMSGLTTSGIKELSKEKSYIFISNHRDIVLDSALLNYLLHLNGYDVAYIAFGDNLLVNESVADLLRMNKGFIVKRGLPPREQLKELKHLSEYIGYIKKNGHNFWIAQREGRAKDGNDTTNSAIIKMLYLSARKNKVDFADFIKKSNIIPVAVSYEKDPCDRIKGWEIHRKVKKGEHKKKKNEDLVSMAAGIAGDKGRVHLTLGKPLSGHYSNEKEVAKAIDQSIFKNYHLWPSNYIAYDTISNTDKYKTQYSPKEKKEFLSRYENLNPEVKEIVLKTYANPVNNFISLST